MFNFYAAPLLLADTYLVNLLVHFANFAQVTGQTYHELICNSNLSTNLWLISGPSGITLPTLLIVIQNLTFVILLCCQLRYHFISELSPRLFPEHLQRKVEGISGMR